MIARIIAWSIERRMLVLLAALVVVGAGVQAVRDTSIDALPDLSDVQVIVRTRAPGAAPQVVEDQITFPLSASLLSVPGATTVRGYSFFGDSFVYVLFDDDTDLYWARARVQEMLARAAERLPAAARPMMGPDATGVGWIYQYALIDPTGRHDIGELRALQDWWLRLELATVPNVAEVATIGGAVAQYQVVLDPVRMINHGLTHGEVITALQRANQTSGGSVLALGEAEVMVRARGYLSNLADFGAIPVAVRGSTPILLRDVAHVQRGPEMRRGVAELDGRGEVVGGVVLLRSGADARATLAAVKARVQDLQQSLPSGVRIVPTYDRSGIIDRAIDNLTNKLAEEVIAVTVVCVLFLWHLRSSLVAVITLPLGILAAFAAMRWQGINANIMSLGGIAIAIGAMVDAAIVMIENAHTHFARWRGEHPGATPDSAQHWAIVRAAAVEVGPALFSSLLIITVSFLPVFALQGQEGRLFGPLAYTKSYAMAAAAALSITLVPVLMGMWIRGRLPHEDTNPLNRWLLAGYRPVLNAVLAWPRATLVLALALTLSAAWPASRLGGEFLPPLDEGDLLYMPTALPGMTAERASALLQQTDRMIRTVPEVATVFGKAGRAETATDPAPLEMFETTIQFKPRAQWRPGMTPEKLVEALDAAVQVPGLTNVWIPPIRNRIEMLATGIKSPIGVRVSGADVAAIDRAASAIARVARGVPGVTSAAAEQLGVGRYLEVTIDRAAAAGVGMNVADVQSVVTSLIGGENVGETVEGRARFPISVRYPRDWRDTPQRLRDLPITAPNGTVTTLGTVARISFDQGPTMIRTENARLIGWVYVDARGQDLASTVEALREAIAARVTLSPGTSIAFAGQYEHLARANARLMWITPLTVGLIGLLLYFAFGRLDRALLIMTTLPFALAGGLWCLYLLGYHQSIATSVGFIALAGVATEFGVVMLIFLDQQWRARVARGQDTVRDLVDAVREGALSRIRPKAMTVCIILASLLPIVVGDGTGSEIMSRIAAPMLGGMITAPLLSLFVVPAAFLLLNRRVARPAVDTAGIRS
jgi:Cu(I)/Ag(I) efflux system membrane protein CusA/SilA